MKNKKISKLFLMMLFLSPLFVLNIVSHADSLPPLPSGFKGVNLLDSFAPANGKGGGMQYSDDASILYMSNKPQQDGSIWSKKQISLSKAFTLSAYLYLGSDNLMENGDGITFTLQDTPLKTGYMGDDGSGIGAYSNKFTNTYSLEFDTYYNGDGTDRGLHNGPHIAFVPGMKNYDLGQTHYGVTEFDKGNLVTNRWKKLVVTGVPSKENGNDMCKITYSVADVNETGKSIGEPYTNTSSFRYNSNDSFASDTVYWGFTSATGEQYETSALSMDTLPQTAAIATRDTTLYAGDEWDPSSNFVSGTDENSDEIKWGDKRITATIDGDTTIPTDKVPNKKPCVVTYTYYSNAVVNGRTIDYTTTATANVTIKTKSQLEAQDATFVVGDKWDPTKVVKTALDDVGHDAKAKVSVVPIVDTNHKQKDLPVTLTYNGMEAQGTVQVTDATDLTVNPKLQLTVGESWSDEKGFVSAVDCNGNKIEKFDSKRVTVEGAVDMTKAGTYTLIYTFIGKNNGHETKVSKDVEVDVVPPPMSLSAPDKVAFSDAHIGDKHPTYWDKQNSVIIEADNTTKWDLTVDLAGGENDEGCLKLGSKAITKDNLEVLASSGKKSIADVVTPENFVKVDYSGVYKAQNDSWTIQWSLAPSSKGIQE